MRGPMGLTQKTEEMYKEYYRDIHHSRRGVEGSTEAAVMMGEMLLCWVWDIQDMVRKFKPANYLDFGCGKGYAYRNRGVDKLMPCGILLHDIGVTEYSSRPDPSNVDAIVCIDVLEHIPEDMLPEVLSYWGACNPKFVFATVAQYPAVATLKNGENAHCTLQPTEWWEALFAQYLSCPMAIAYAPKPQGYRIKRYNGA